MAKQQRRGIGPSGVVMAAAAESQQRGKFIDYGDAFMKGYDRSQVARKEKEKEAQDIMNRTNEYMDQFNNDIDVIKYSPEDQALVKDAITGWRSEFAEAASAAAKIEDKTSPEYQKHMDTMNGIKARMSNLKNNIDNLAKHKAEYGADIKRGNAFSTVSTNIEALNQGSTMLEQNIGGITPDGDLTWGEGENQFSFQNYKEPISRGLDQARSVNELANKWQYSNKKITPADENYIRDEVEAIFEGNRSIEAMMATKDHQLYNFDDLDPAKPEDREEAINRIVNGVISNAKSTFNPPKSRTTTGAGGYDRNQKRYLSQLTAAASDPSITISIPKQNGSYTWDADLLQFIPVNNDGSRRADADGIVHTVDLEDYARLTGIKLSDVQSKLGIK